MTPCWRGCACRYNFGYGPFQLHSRSLFKNIRHMIPSGKSLFSPTLTWEIVLICRPIVGARMEWCLYLLETSSTIMFFHLSVVKFSENIYLIHILSHISTDAASILYLFNVLRILIGTTHLLLQEGNNYIYLRATLSDHHQYLNLSIFSRSSMQT